MKVFLAIAVLILVLLFSCHAQDDNRQRLKGHETKFVLNQDTIAVNTFNIHYLERESDTLFFLRKTISPYKMKSIVSGLIGNEYKHQLISVDVSLQPPSSSNLKKWTITNEDVYQLGAYYLKANQIYFSFYDLEKEESFSYGPMADASCAVNSMFLMKNRKKAQKRLAMLSFNLPLSELPAASELKLIDKKDDSLYQAQALYFKDYY